MLGKWEYSGSVCKTKDHAPSAWGYCQPSPAPLLQSFDLQRILEGEKAQRTEAARQLKDVEKRLALQRTPAVQLASPLPGASLKTADPVQLELDRARLQEQIKQHSAQVLCSCTCCAASCRRAKLACALGAAGGSMCRCHLLCSWHVVAVMDSAGAAASAEQRLELGRALR